LNSGSPEVSRRSLDGVDQPLGDCTIIVGQSGGDTLGGIGFSLRELPRKF